MHSDLLSGSIAFLYTYDAIGDKFSLQMAVLFHALSRKKSIFLPLAIWLIRCTMKAKIWLLSTGLVV